MCPSLEGLLQSPQISSPLRGSSMSVRGHSAKAMTARSDEKTGVNLCSSPRLPGAFSNWTLPDHQLCPCLCHLHTARAGSGPHAGWLVPLSSCAVSPHHRILGRGSTLCCLLGENPSCPSMELSPGPARTPPHPHRSLETRTAQKEEK